MITQRHTFALAEFQGTMVFCYVGREMAYKESSDPELCDSKRGQAPT